MTVYPSPAARSEIKPLTGIRGIAAVLVMLYHYSHPVGEMRIPSQYTVPFGYMAVDLFFVLSGYVLAYNYYDKLSSRGFGTGYGSFLWKRITRIYPAYIAITSVYFLKMALDYSGNNPLAKYGVADYLINVFLLTGWGFGGRTILGPSWSVSAEMFCYIVFPLVIAAVARLSTGLFLVLGAVLTLALLMTFGPGVAGPLDIVSGDTLLTIVRAIAGFSLGAFCYALHRETRTLDRRIVEGLSILAGAVLLASWTIGTSEWLTYLSIVVLIYTVGFDGKVANLLFGNRVSYFLGNVSYSIYLIHVLFISSAMNVTYRLSQKIDFSLAYWSTLAAYALGVVVLSYGSYLLFEIRGRKAMARVFGHLHQAFMRRFAARSGATPV